MDTNGIWQLMDLVVLGCGFYALYAAFLLRTKGEIVKTFLVFKDTDASSCKNLPEYARLMSPKLSALGGVMIAYGAVSLIHTYVVAIDGLYMAFIGILIVVLIWYGFAASKAAKKYF